MASNDLFAFLDLIFNQAWLWLFSISLSIFFVLRYLKNKETDEWTPYDQILITSPSQKIRPIEELTLLVDQLRSSNIEGYVHLVRRELSKILAIKLGIPESEFMAIRSSVEEMRNIIPDKNSRLFFFNPDLWMNSVAGNQSLFLFRKIDESKVKEGLIPIINQVKKISPQRGENYEF